MLKILLIPKAEYLTEYDVGFHREELTLLDAEERKIRTAGYDWNPKGGKKLSYNQYTVKLEALRQKHVDTINKAKETVALVNSKEKAEKAIKYFRATDDTYLKCEFEIVRAKK